MPNWGTDKQEIWADAQLVQASVPETLSSPVRRLLNTWRGIHHDPADRNEIIRLFSELARGHALEVPENNGYTWVAVRPGQISVADVVRVKLNAYAGDIGQRHNGRVGRVVAIRSGDVIVNTIDDGPPFEGTHHSPHALDKRVRAS